MKSRNGLFSILAAGLILTPLFAQDAAPPLAPDLALPFYVYHGFHARENHFAPSGWMGDYGDIRLNDDFKSDPKSDKAVIKITYTGKLSRKEGWAGIYWQNPPNNWGSRAGGYNLNGAKKLVFMVKGDKGGETIDQFKIGGINGNFSDSGSAAIGPVTLSKEWKPYEISLEGQELSSISGGFCWVVNHDENPDGATFYLDDIRYE